MNTTTVTSADPDAAPRPHPGRWSFHERPARIRAGKLFADPRET
jgi:hypothetical protein